MLELESYSVLDEREKDEQGNPDKIISFTLPSYNTPFLFYNCICPSTKREYFVETDRKTCKAAKAGSFGYGEDVEWVEEW